MCLSSFGKTSQKLKKGQKALHLTHMWREVSGPMEKSSKSSPNGFLMALAT
jgi:hypothetical protein